MITDSEMCMTEFSSSSFGVCVMYGNVFLNTHSIMNYCLCTDNSRTTQ